MGARVVTLGGTGLYQNYLSAGLIQVSAPSDIPNFQEWVEIPWCPGMALDFSNVRFAQVDDTPVLAHRYSYTHMGSAIFWLRVPDANQTELYFYFDGGDQTSLLSAGAAVFNQYNQFAASGNLENTVDNNGNERHVWYDKAQNDLTGAYSLTNTPTWAAGAYTLDSADMMTRDLAATDTEGKWEKVVSFETAWAANQYSYLILGSNTTLYVKRSDAPGANEIWMSLTVNGVTLIAYTDTGATLADSTYARAEVTYDGTNWQMYWASVAVGAATPGDAPANPRIGVMAFSTQIKCIDLSFSPNIAYQDTTPGTNIARYAQVTGTIAASGNDINMTAAAGAGNYVRERAISYQYGKGNRRKKITLPAACDNGDYINIKLCASGDLLNGYGLGVIRTGGAWNVCTVLNTTVTDTGTTVAGLADGDAVYIEASWDADSGVYYGYVYESVKPTAPQVTVFNAGYNYGYTGVVGYNAGASAKVFVLNTVTIRANNIIGRTNIPATESGWYFQTGFGTDESGRWSQLYGNSAVTYGGAGKMTIVGGTIATTNTTRLNPVISSYGEMYVGIACQSAVAEVKGSHFMFGWRGGQSLGTPQYCYDVVFLFNSDVVTLRRYDTGSTTLFSQSFPLYDNQIYPLKVVWSPSGQIDVYVDSGAGYTLVGTATDTTYSSGYIGLGGYHATAANNNWEFRNLVVSGTRYYYQPMLRGVQVGQYYTGSSTVAATGFTDDFNSNSSAEWTVAAGTATFDTTIGVVQRASGTLYLRQSPVMGSGYYQNFFYIDSVASAYATHTIFCWDGGVTGVVPNNGYSVRVRANSTSVEIHKFVGGGDTTLQSGTVPWTYAANDRILVSILFLASTGSIAAVIVNMTQNKIYSFSTTDGTYISGYFGFGQENSSLHQRYCGMIINAIESTSTNGVTRTHGSVSHGNMWGTGITAGYLMREYEATEPELSRAYLGPNPFAPRRTWSDGNRAGDCEFAVGYEITDVKADLSGLVTGFGAKYGMTVLGDLSVIPSPVMVGYGFDSVAARVDCANINDLIILGKAGRNIQNRLYQGRFDFDKSGTGGVYSGIYFKHVQFLIPDYAGTTNCALVGIFPRSSNRYVPGADKETLTAVDYGFYLSQQVLNMRDLSLLTPANQATQRIYQLWFNTGSTRFTAGMSVHGATSGDWGVITEVSGYYWGWLLIQNPTGIFTDGENLQVGGVTYAKAYGHAVDVTGTPSTVYPDDWLYNVLGGASWASVTGIEPYRLTDTSTIWGVTITATDQYFNEEVKKIEAIQAWCEILDFIFLVKWRWNASVSLYTPCAYFVPMASIDTPGAGLDLPAAVTVTYNHAISPPGTDAGAFVVGDIQYEQVGEEKKNVVWVRAPTLAGVWLEKMIKSTGVEAGEEPWLMYYERNLSLSTQAEVDQRAQDIFDYFQYMVSKWQVRFLMRSDFQLLQKLTFSGWGVKIPNGDYRIVGIEYVYGMDGKKPVNYVDVTLIQDSMFTSQLRLKRVFTSAIDTIQKTIKKANNELPKNRVGTIRTISGDVVTVDTDAGTTVIARRQ